MNIVQVFCTWHVLTEGGVPLVQDVWHSVPANHDINRLHQYQHGRASNKAPSCAVPLQVVYTPVVAVSISRVVQIRFYIIRRHLHVFIRIVGDQHMPRSPATWSMASAQRDAKTILNIIIVTNGKEQN